MGRANSIGGVFFKVKDPAATRAWYQENLGLNTDEYGTNFEWRKAESEEKGFTLWAPFNSTSDYFDGPFMINLRVSDMNGLLKELEAKGVEIVGEIANENYGRFVHIIDNDGNKVELWEPNDKAYDEMIGDARTT